MGSRSCPYTSSPSPTTIALPILYCQYIVTTEPASESDTGERPNGLGRSLVLPRRLHPAMELREAKEAIAENLREIAAWAREYGQLAQDEGQDLIGFELEGGAEPIERFAEEVER